MGDGTGILIDLITNVLMIVILMLLVIVLLLVQTVGLNGRAVMVDFVNQLVNILVVTTKTLNCNFYLFIFIQE